jgi:hypothetical protein
MTTFSISLRVFRQPIILISIMVLLINDHILKIVMPSWITGKLSDFAGLFFFPFLLAAVLAFPLEALGGKPRPIFGWACIFTGLWFSLMKTVLPINELTATFAGWLVNAQAQIVMDVTDLIALPMIWLAWRLWVRIETTQLHQPVGKFAYVVIGIGTLAALASSPCPPLRSVQKSVMVGNTNYFQAFNLGTYDSIEVYGDGAVWSYNNQIDAWQPITTVPDEVTIALAKPVELPKVVCAPSSPLHCLRIDGEPRVYETMNGGKTWEIAWEEPWWRKGYMERQAREPMRCGTRVVELRTYDVASLPTGSHYNFVVALGSRGFLLQETNGAWADDEIFTFRNPSGYAGDAFIELVFTLAPENLAALILFALIMVVFPVVKRKQLLGSAHGASSVMGTAFMVACSVPVVWSLFVLWAYGAIPYYELTVILAMLIIGGAIYWGLRQVREGGDSDKQR